MKHRNPIIVPPTPPTSLDPAPSSSMQTNPIRRSDIDHLLARIAGRDYWFAYDAELDIAHVWISTNQADAVAYPIDNQTDILIDDRSGVVLGCTINDFRPLYLRALPTWKLRLHDAGLHLELKRDVPMQRIEYLDVTWPVLPFERTDRRIARVITAHAAYFPLAANAISA